MQEELKNTPDIDPSGLFSTYKTHPESENIAKGEVSQIHTIIHPTTIAEELKKDEEKDSVKIFRIIVDGGVRMTKVAVWSIAVFGGLFVAALATNTIDRAISIINANIGTHISLSGEVSVKEVAVVQDGQKSTDQGLTSSTISNPTSTTPDAIASKRRAVLEARKAAKLLEEKQKELEQSL